MLVIFADFSEFVRFFQNSKNQGVTSLGNSTFDDSNVTENLDPAFKIEKFVFFGRLKLRNFDCLKNTNFAILKAASRFSLILLSSKVESPNNITF